MGVNALKNKLLIIEMISDDSEENVSWQSHTLKILCTCEKGIVQRNLLANTFFKMETNICTLIWKQTQRDLIYSF